MKYWHEYRTLLAVLTEHRKQFMVNAKGNIGDENLFGTVPPKFCTLLTLVSFMKTKMRKMVSWRELLNLEQTLLKSSIVKNAIGISSRQIKNAHQPFRTEVQNYIQI
ncbi:hypothetical protein CEXT_407031 [Caerostris extrusa]|uniref:Uncharacterized protein n=1 Tax=Caerostris extrusa TaxID=172846 RepID=A0AAV4XZ40_CAEEX|nr:hypothetical protein CEXT_407031 [Caerostris extrusa]